MRTPPPAAATLRGGTSAAPPRLARPWPRRRPALWWLGCALAAPAAWAAPLDALLTATPERQQAQARLELGVDQATRALDFSTSADPATQNPAVTSGDYTGTQLHLAWRASPRLWLSGGLHQRQISNAVDRFNYRSWQLAGQYRLLDAEGRRPALALRLGAWGTQARATEATTPVRVPGAILDTVTISRPQDQQLQLDLLATWPLSSRLDVGLQLGAGRSRLAYGALAATTTRNGCPYQLQFTGNDIFGTLARPCTGAGGGVITQFFDSSGDYGVDVGPEIAWRGQFVQAGANAHWRSGRWAVAGAYLLHSQRRQGVDAILKSRGDPVVRHNHQLVAEVAYDLRPGLGGAQGTAAATAAPAWAGWRDARLSVFGRLQLNSHLFFNDIPVTYNSSTSGSFGNRFALLTLGLRGSF